MFAGENNTTKCYGAYFSDTLCPDGLVINITSAVYGISPCEARACCPTNTDCTGQVRNAFWESIIKECNEKHSCGHLRANWNQVSECGGKFSNYVTIYFICEQEGKIVVLCLQFGILFEN